VPCAHLEVAHHFRVRLEALAARNDDAWLVGGRDRRRRRRHLLGRARRGAARRAAQKALHGAAAAQRRVAHHQAQELVERGLALLCDGFGVGAAADGAEEARGHAGQEAA